MRVLGIDPGLTRCGFGVVDAAPGASVQLVAVDVVRTDAGEPTGHRLRRIETAVEDWIARFEPDAVAVERVFSQHNVRTVMQTAQAAGIVLLVAARHDLPVALHTPSEVKAAVTGSGRADKAQVTTMVTKLLHLDARPTPADAADALALAICHAWRAPVQQRLAAVAAGTAGRSRTW